MSFKEVISSIRVNAFVTLKADIESVRVGDIGRIVGLEYYGCANIKFAVGTLTDIPVSLLVPPPLVFSGGIGSKVKCTNHPSIQKGSVGTLVGPSRDKNYRDYVEVAFEDGTYLIDESQLSLIHSHKPNADALAGLVRKLKIDGKKTKQTIEEIRASFGQTKTQTPTHANIFSEEDEIPTSLRTEDVTLISHAHGRQRRGERNIERKELQAAIKHGKKDIANPGRDGSNRWRYEHLGVVYITDETSRHEVTSWRIDGQDEDEEEEIAPAEVELAGKGCHAVLIVDNSASMRASDVPGFETRAKAVYQCLKNDFAKEQLKSGAADDVVVTLISMSDDANVLINTQPLDESFIKKIGQISKRRPKSHGNYIPALDKALEVMTADAPNRSSVLLLFFSDGAPSDHSSMKCEHGIQIFDIDYKVDPKMQHKSKGSAWNCKKQITEKVAKDCCNRVKRIGQVFGRDKVIFRTLAFGPPKEDFRLLEQMAGVLPRGEFQKLGLNAANLKTAFSSVSSSLLTLRTEGGHRASLTRRSDKVVDINQNVDPTLTNLAETDGWYIYAFGDFIGKFQFPDDDETQSYKTQATGKKLETSALSPGANGFAFYETPYQEGAERFVYRCTEISAPIGYRSNGCLSSTAKRCGLRLVAKEAKDVENHHQGRKWHEQFAQTQLIAGTLAKAFTKRLPSSPRRGEWTVTFIKAIIYGCVDLTYKHGQAWVLVEQELDGKFTKWNNNAGIVRRSTTTVARPTKSNDNNNFETVMGTLGAFDEVDEDDEDEDSNDEEERVPIELDDIPQAFSHFSYEHSTGRQLVCDLQGVWNADDGYLLTDPVVHQVGEGESGKQQRHINGATDKGLVGIKNFFDTHVCSSLCKKMGLPIRTPSSNLINYIIQPATTPTKKQRQKKWKNSRPKTSKVTRSSASKMQRQAIDSKGRR